MTVGPYWDLDIAGWPHRVDLAPYDIVAGPPRRFRFDGRDGELSASSAWTSFRWGFLSMPTGGVATFELGGRPASLKLAAAKPRLKLRSQMPPLWLLYDLTVGGKPRGTWVASLEGEYHSYLAGWWFVEPGQRLPTRDDDTWPPPEQAAQLRTLRDAVPRGDPWSHVPPSREAAPLPNTGDERSATELERSRENAEILSYVLFASWFIGFVIVGLLTVLSVIPDKSSGAWMLFFGGIWIMIPAIVVADWLIDAADRSHPRSPVMALVAAAVRVLSVIAVLALILEGLVAPSVLVVMLPNDVLQLAGAIGLVALLASMGLVWLVVRREVG